MKCIFGWCILVLVSFQPSAFAFDCVDEAGGDENKKVRIFAHDPDGSGNTEYVLEFGKNRVQLKRGPRKSYIGETDPERFDEADKKKYQKIWVNHDFYGFEFEHKGKKQRAMFQLNEISRFLHNTNISRTNSGSVLSVFGRKFALECR